MCGGDAAGLIVGAEDVAPGAGATAGAGFVAAKPPLGGKLRGPAFEVCLPLVIRIAITQAAFDAIAETLALGTVGVEPEPNEKGEREIWLDEGALNRLRLMGGPGESYSDVILRLAALYPSSRGS